MISRSIRPLIESLIDNEKAIIIKGARQVGKTTLTQQLFGENKQVLWIDGDDPQTRVRWENINKTNIRLFIQDFDCIVFDEAQRISNVGLAVKMILDMKLNKQVVVTGSSTLNLSSKINEPLTGRKWSFELFPFSWSEIVNHKKLLPSIQALDLYLIYGLYPEIYTSKDHKMRRLKELASSYLYKDVLEVGGIRKPEVIIKLLRALAYQVGSEVSYNELSNMLQIDNETVKRYISLLEDSYVIFRLTPLSNNPRKEISTSRKIYFYDNGIRNALINNFNPLAERNDIGALWENFIISEFIKKSTYEEQGKKLYFWRDKKGAEIDLLIESNGSIAAFEIKSSDRKKGYFSKSFVQKYNPNQQTTIHRNNFFEYL